MADLQKLLDEAEMATNLRQVVGALVFSSPAPLGIDAIRKCLRDLPSEKEGEEPPFKKVLPRDIHKALQAIQEELERLSIGVELREVADGYRFQTQAEAGPWVRSLLKKDKPARLSPTSLETLAIIAYRQPIAKSEIEGIRGVTVDHVVRALMEMHLIRIIGRSDLPGRPFLYGTTPLFLEHFGLKSLEELNDIDPTLKRQESAKLPRKTRKAPGKQEPETAAQELAALTAASGDAKEDSGKDGGDAVFVQPDLAPAPAQADQEAAPVYSVGDDDEEAEPPQRGSVVFIQGDTGDDDEEEDWDESFSEDEETDDESGDADGADPDGPSDDEESGDDGSDADPGESSDGEEERPGED